MQRLLLDMRHTSMGFESMQKYFSPPSIESAIRLRIFSQSSLVDFLLSLNWRLEIRLGISFLLSANFLKGSFHCRYLMSPLLNSRLSLLYPKTLEPLLFACYSLLYSLNHMRIVCRSRVFFWILHESCCIRWFDIKSFITSNILQINIMCNFLLPFFYLFNSANRV